MSQTQFDLFKAMMFTQMSQINSALTALAPAIPSPVVHVPVLTPVVPVVSTPCTALSPAGNSTGNPTLQQILDMMSAVVRNSPAPSVVVQAAQSDTKRNDHLALELVKGVYCPVYFDSYFPPVDIDGVTGRVTHYNISFAVDAMRLQKNQVNTLDPDLSDATLKALMFLKFNAGPTGISLHAILGKTADLVIWTDVLKALRIFRQVCANFIHPNLALHISHLLTQVEDLRSQFPAISVPQWVRIFHTIFAKLRGVEAILQANPHQDYSIMMSSLFAFDADSKLFREAERVASIGYSSRSAPRSSSPSRKRRRTLPLASTTPGNIDQPNASKKSQNPNKPQRPHLQGESPCYNWVCNRAPCFESVHCVVVAGQKPRARPRPHAFDPIDKGIEAEFRSWVLKYANN